MSSLLSHPILLYRESSGHVLWYSEFGPILVLLRYTYQQYCSSWFWREQLAGISRITSDELPRNSRHAASSNLLYIHQWSWLYIIRPAIVRRNIRLRWAAESSQVPVTPREIWMKSNSRRVCCKAGLVGCANILIVIVFGPPTDPILPFAVLLFAYFMSIGCATLSLLVEHSRVFLRCRIASDVV